MRSQLCSTLLLVTLPAIAALAHASDIAADAIYSKTGVQGGLVVHLGCGTGALTAGLCANERYLVVGLDADAKTVAKAREALSSQGKYGRVSIQQYDGQTLPFVRNLVNLLVVNDAAEVPQEEMMRVLAPEGVAYVKQADGWQKTTKPRPTEIDEWSHFLHDAAGNAVANDSEIGSPRNLRWVAGPRWCRSHEIPSSVGAVVTAGGRIFTIFDEGPMGVYKKLPADCKLIARDAANGVLLWKRSLTGWQEEQGTGTGNRWNIHHTIPRRVVVAGDRVFVTLGFLNSPVSVLDAATGETLVEALPGTVGADEILVCDDVLIAKTTNDRSAGASQRFGKDALADSLVAVDVKTGKQLWKIKQTQVVPYALSAAEGRVVYHNMDQLVCLDLKTGDEVWTCPNKINSTVGGGSTLTIVDGVVLYHGHTVVAAPPKPAAKQPKRKPGSAARLTAVSLADGKQLWQERGAGSLAAACTQPTDLFVIDGNVWCGSSLTARDLKTGEPTKTLSIGKTISPGHHYRCHRGKATEKFLIWPKRGAEFLDVTGDQHMRNDWLRAPCFTGATPANGLLYVPPSQCFCYPGAKVFGFLALSTEDNKPLVPATDANLTKGPAYNSGRDPRLTDADWPRYRANGQLSGSNTAIVSPEVTKKWQIQLDGPVTQPVVVGNKLWVAEKQTHRIRCFDTETGEERWSFTAGGPIDSSPTWDRGRIIFGCRDGCVYHLLDSSGELVWKFQAAPDNRQTVSFEQVESLWPVHGSVAVENNVVYFAAGRSSFLDGGIVVYGLDADSGDVRYRHVLEGPWPDVMTETGTPFAMEGALPDLIVSDGEHLYMQRIKFDLELNRLPTTQESSLGELDMGGKHLTATGGFLDDTGFDRVYWMHSRRWPGFYFAQQSPKAGQLVVFDDATTYAVKYFYRRIMWSPAFLPAEHGYLLFADDIDNEPILTGKGETATAIDWLPKESATDKFRRGGRGVEKGTGYMRAAPAKWQKMVPVRIRAMVKAGDVLFAAGPKDQLDPDDPYAQFEGRDSVLVAYSAEDGSPIHTQKLESAPAFDGLSAAGERLYLATLDGKIICFGE